MAHRWIVAAFVAGGLVGCASTPAPDPEVAAQTTFDHSVEPILYERCTSNTGCHAANVGDPYAAVSAYVLADDAYQATVDYAGDFTASAPLLTAHPMEAYLSAADLAVIEDWFAQERAARGL